MPPFLSSGVLIFYLLCLLFCRSFAAFNDTIVTISQGTFRGTYSATYNITSFRKIQFGASTAGENQFRAPQPPPHLANGTVYDSDQSFDMCPQRTVNGSEDCLYLGLYSRPRTQQTPLRPVLVVFYGGGFIQGSASFSIPPSMYPVLNVSRLNDYIVVYPNYRVAAFGFLPGAAVKESSTSNLNVGLLDGQAALQWVHENIEAFGGDPKSVTIQGQSAGGGQVVGQILANGGNTTPRLFQKALLGSPFWPKAYEYDSDEAEQLYQQIASLAGCANATDSLTCLKSADLQTLRNASLTLTSAHTYNTSSYTWAPVVDGSFLPELLSSATAKGAVNADLVWGSYNSHEGEIFVSPNLQNSYNNGTAGAVFNNSLASFDSYLRGFLPGLSSEQTEQVKKLYPIRGSTETLTWNTTYVRAGVIFRDVVLACPAYWTGQSARERGYVVEYSIPPAKHGTDTQYVRPSFTPSFLLPFPSHLRCGTDTVVVEPSQRHPEIRSHYVRRICRSDGKFLRDRRPERAQVDRRVPGGAAGDSRDWSGVADCAGKFHTGEADAAAGKVRVLEESGTCGTGLICNRIAATFFEVKKQRSIYI